MLGIDVRAAKATWTVFLMVLLIGLIWMARGAILIFIFALFAAYLVYPLVTFVERFMPRRIPHSIALTLVYSCLILAVFVGVSTLGSQIAAQGATLATKLPDLLRAQSNLLSQPWPNWIEPYRGQIQQAVRAQLELGTEQIVPMIQQAGKSLLFGLGNLIYLVIVPVLSFLFLLDPRGLRDGIVEVFRDSGRRLLVEQVLNDVHLLIGLYIRALVTLAAAVFVFYSLFFEITGVPYALLLAVIAAPLEFIPVLGWISGGVIAVAVAGFSGYDHLGWMIIFILVYRIFQDYVLQPYLMSAGIELHPVLVLFGVLAGERIAGVPGMLLSVPALATVRVIYRRARTIEPGP
jgi:predicted PurR-regulated permease PerM